MLSTANAGGFWRWALAALAEAFDPAREAYDPGAVFQTAPARERVEPRPEHEDPLEASRPPEETLQ